MDIAFLNSSKGKPLITSKKKNTNDKHVIYRFFLKKGYNVRMLEASLLLFCPLKKICANAPEKKDQHPSV